MKTVGKFLLVFLFVIICGCKSNSEPVSITMKSIAFVADITYYNDNYSCECEIDKDGNASILITAPENLKGISASFNGDTCSIKYNGLEINNADMLLPQNSAINIFKDVLKISVDGGEVKKNKNLVINGECNGNKYILTASPNGLPISLEIPEFGMIITFKNVTIIEK